jgi:hypothetical protein
VIVLEQASDYSSSAYNPPNKLFITKIYGGFVNYAKIVSTACIVPKISNFLSKK